MLGSLAAQRAWRALNGGTQSATSKPHSRKASKTLAKISGYTSKSNTSKSSKTAIKSGHVVNEGTGGQCSYFNGPRGTSYLPKHVEDALPPQVLQFNGPGQTKSGIGLQAVSVPVNLFTPTVVLDYTGDKISSALCKRATSDLTINNVYLSNCYIIIYDIFCRKDIGVSAIDTPLAAWQQGATDESATNSYQVLGSTPWQSELFNQFYRVAQTTKVVLAAGGTHVHHIRLYPERLISSAYAEYSEFGIKDLTYFCMVEIHGSPANDTMTQTQVSVGVGGINWIADSEQTLKQIAKATPTITVAQSLLTSFTNGEQVVNLGGSTIVAQAEG